MKNGENEKTAEDMQQDSIVVSEKFLYLGVKRADTITICMPDCYEAAVCALAADKIGDLCHPSWCKISYNQQLSLIK